MNNKIILFIHDIISPLDQFSVLKYISIDAGISFDINISLTNITFYLTVGGFFCITLHLLAQNYKVISNAWSLSFESLYATIHSICNRLSYFILPAPHNRKLSVVQNSLFSYIGYLLIIFVLLLMLLVITHNITDLVPQYYESGSGGYYRYHCKHWMCCDCQNWVWLNNTPCTGCFVRNPHEPS